MPGRYAAQRDRVKTHFLKPILGFILATVIIIVVAFFALNAAVDRTNAYAAELQSQLKGASREVAEVKLGKPNSTGMRHPRIMSPETGKVEKEFEPYEWWYYTPSLAAPVGLMVFLRNGRVSSFKNGWD